MRRLLPTALLCLAAPAAAQDREVPYWATLRAEEVNMRVGPSEAYPIEWVYRRPGLPVKVLRVNQGWRLVEDPDGERGWIVARLLDPDRGAIVVGDGLAEMRAEPGTGARSNGASSRAWSASSAIARPAGASSTSAAARAGSAPSACGARASLRTFQPPVSPVPAAASRTR